MNDEDKSFLDKAWECILQQYQKKAEYNSREFGAGISSFIMLRTPRGETNCKYCYGAREDEQDGPWKTLVLQFPNRKTFLSKYDPEKNYAICVSISTKDGLTAGIRLFKYDTGEEIVLPDADPPDSETST
uniref:Uncharacterized protein n=1 Tax=Marseillevirus LCMAC101 TaxID=2506602 RepID=A0A481YS12_9VIRU|nr:MAG: uncharacterized protein LCMAC101_03220 [Marseillevirus LCMAC101]